MQTKNTVVNAQRNRIFKLEIEQGAGKDPLSRPRRKLQISNSLNSFSCPENFLSSVIYACPCLMASAHEEHSGDPGTAVSRRDILCSF